jgi:hypothetical protein
MFSRLRSASQGLPSACGIAGAFTYLDTGSSIGEVKEVLVDKSSGPNLDFERRD